MDISTLRRSLVALVVSLGIAASASAQQYPNKTIRIIVPVPPGGAMDISTRLVAQKMSEKLGQTIGPYIRILVHCTR